MPPWTQSRYEINDRVRLKHQNACPGAGRRAKSPAGQGRAADGCKGRA